ncbi:hypothetical protein [Clostridium botulinum]|uniref:hypothetical protein n=1 Tax=Clostridium botulinum TaxID=1491 RepID=UPI003DA39EFE
MEIQFGVLEPTFKEQLDKQNLVDSKVEKHEKIRNSVNMLRLHDFITDKQCYKMFEKLFKDIKNNVTKK